MTIDCNNYHPTPKWIYLAQWGQQTLRTLLPAAQRCLFIINIIINTLSQGGQLVSDTAPSVRPSVFPIQNRWGLRLLKGYQLKGLLPAVLSPLPPTIVPSNQAEGRAHPVVIRYAQNKNTTTQRPLAKRDRRLNRVREGRKNVLLLKGWKQIKNGFLGIKIMQTSAERGWWSGVVPDKRNTQTQCSSAAIVWTCAWTPFFLVLCFNPCRTVVVVGSCCCLLILVANKHGLFVLPTTSRLVVGWRNHRCRGWSVWHLRLKCCCVCSHLLFYAIWRASK